MLKRGHDDDETSTEDVTKKAAVDTARNKAMTAVSAMLSAPKNPAVPPAPKNPAAPTLSAPTPNPVKNHPYTPYCYNCLKSALSNLDMGSLDLVLTDYPCLKSMNDHGLFDVIMNKALLVNSTNFAARVLYRHGIYPHNFDGAWLASISPELVGETFKIVQDDPVKRALLLSCLIKKRGIKSIISLVDHKHIPPLWQIASLILQSVKERGTDLEFFDDFERIIVRCCEARKDAPLDEMEATVYCYAILSIFNRDEWRKTVDMSRIEEPYHVFPIINLLLEIITRPDSEAMKITFDKQRLMQGLAKLNTVPIKPEAVLFLLRFNCFSGSIGPDLKKPDV